MAVARVLRANAVLASFSGARACNDAIYAIAQERRRSRQRQKLSRGPDVTRGSGRGKRRGLGRGSGKIPVYESSRYVQTYSRELK